MDPAKLKVVELRAELSQRGLETKGNKAVLVERLRNALEEENGDAVAETTILDTSVEEGADATITETHERSPEPPKPPPTAKTPGRSSRGSAASSPVKTPSRAAAKAAAAALSPIKQPPSPPTTQVTEEQRTPSPVTEIPAASEPVSQEPEAPPRATTPENLADSSSRSPESEAPVEAEEKTEEKLEQPSAEAVNETLEETPREEEKEKEKEEKEEAEQVPVVQAEEPKEESKPVDIGAENVSSLPEKMEEDSAPVTDVKLEPKETEEEVEEEKKTPELVPSSELPEESEAEVNSVVKKEEEDVDEPVKEEKEQQESVRETESENGVEVKEEKMEEEDTNETETEKKDSDSNVEVKAEIEKDEKSPSKIFNSEPTVPGEEGPGEEIQADQKGEKIDYLDYDERTPRTDDQDVEMKDSKNEEDSDNARDRDRKDRRDRKRKRSSSPQQERYRSPPPTKPDDEPEIEDGSVLLSWYDSDLNLMINKDNFCSATPMHNDGFGYIWAGTRASFGFRTGKLYYETKVTENCNINLQDEENPHVLRVGWSVAGTSTQLGEEKFSYGYGGTGKISTNCKFQDYGKQFGKDDVVGCYADLTGDTNIDLSFTVNGEDQGVAFSISKEEIGDVALYPHILTKNCSFGCNFGQEEPWSSPILPGFISVGEVDPQERIPGPRRPEKKEDCEMLLMCGLPAAGKTQWALQYAAQHPEKMYNILGTNTLIDKMKVMGLPRKRNYHGRWELLIDKCTRALNKLLEIASTRRRNYILDQTNVYPTAQRRKMRHFYGFQRKAVVVVPTDEEFKLRTAKREAIEGKDVPDSAVLEMKANFSAPTVGESFESIEYVELGEEEAKKLIEKYNKEGKEAGFSQQQISKRPRFEKADSHRDSRDSRSSRDSRDSRDHRDRRGGYPDRNRNMGGGWRGGNNGGGWRDRPQRGGGGGSSGGSGSGGSSGGGGHPRHGGSSGSSGYGAPSSGGGWRGGRGGSSVPPHRGGNDRRGGGGDRRPTGGNDRNRGLAQRQGGGWGAMGYQGSQQQQQGGSGWGQQSGWTGSQSQQQTGWGQQGGWGQQQWGGWKGFGQGSYGQASYNQQNYGNGNWGGWNQQQQYYNQYWNQQQQQQQSGQGAVTGGGQPVTTAGNTNTTSVSTTNTAAYGYPQGWQGYAQAYAFPAQTTTTNSQQAQQQK